MLTDSLGVEGDAAIIVDVAALLGGDCPALLLHHHVTLLKVTNTLAPYDVKLSRLSCLGKALSSHCCCRTVVHFYNDMI